MKKNIYIFSDGDLKRKDNTLRFLCEERQQYLPVEDISDIYAFGEINITKKLLELLSQKEIILHYFNYYGYYMGSFYPREHYNSGYLLLKQAEAYNDVGHRLGLAKGFVEGSLKNIRQVLKYYENRDKDVGDSLLKIEACLETIDEQPDIPTLMAVEGHAREIYYQCFDQILDNSDFVFDKRTRRPPQNNLNTLISFGNSVLYTIVLSEIYRTHLDPRIAYLHTSNFRRFSLNLDVAEIFKPIIIDRAILSVVGKNQIKKGDFKGDYNGILLKDGGKQNFLNEIERRLGQTIEIKALKRKVSYRRLIRMELYKIEKDLMGETPYAPYVSRW